MTFLIENLGSIIVALILAVIIGFAIKNMINDEKKGRCSCGSCSDCGHVCHIFQKTVTEKNKSDYLN